MNAGLEALRQKYPSIPVAALAVYQDVWIETGDEAAGWAAVRNDSRYDTWFPGNKTPEGEVRYAEGNYAAARESYRDVLRSVGLKLPLFEGRITDLMNGEVSPNEFMNRVTAVNDRVIAASEQIKQYYSDTYGIGGLTTKQLLAGALDPTIGDKVLAGEISAAEVGGEALQSGFNLTIGKVEELVANGMDRSKANELFGRAETLVPILEVLAKRHNDPDDEFNVEDFLQSEFFSDPEQNLRMRRMISQERSMFGTSPGMHRERNGAMTGLIPE